MTHSERHPVFIELSLACNNGCRFCSQALARREGPADPAVNQTVSRQLEAGSSKSESVMFLGGEPTLVDDLPAWVAQAKALGYRRIGIQTNARRLAYKTYAESLLAAGLTHLDVSLHGTSSAMHDYHTRVPGSFKQTAAGIRLMGSLGLKITVTTVVTRSNYRHLHELVEVLAYLGVSSWHLSMVHPAGEASTMPSQLIPPWEMLRPHLENARTNASRKAISLVASGIPTCVLDLGTPVFSWPHDLRVAACEVCGKESCSPEPSDSEEALLEASRGLLLGGMGLR